MGAGDERAPQPGRIPPRARDGAYVHLAPQITEATGLGEGWVTPLVLLFGLGLFIGNRLGGKLADPALIPLRLDRVPPAQPYENQPVQPYENQPVQIAHHH
ncbi:hypothetical protein [Streptosporangium roseum]|uniref:hypothetical protein n=1 Tax=Streptosporangium roseum TaxID=2001 RepID=UPI0004CD251C|nr:hypothetical protein [Streptosporangium roseum]